VTDPAAFWPGVLGISFLIVGLITYRRDLWRGGHEGVDLTAVGPVFVAAALAAFAGEHFTAAASLAQIVPKWMPARLFIAYFVGVAHLAAALSFVARRYIRLSSACLALMFGLFVLLMDLPSAVSNPTVRMAWSLTARETTFAIGALALFAIATRSEIPGRADRIATIAGIWTAAVLVFYGIENILFPQFLPGVPDATPTATWLPFPTLIAYATGILLVVFGLAMFVHKYARSAATGAGLLMTLLTLGIFVPQWVMAHTVGQQVNAINFVFDTLLFAGTVLVIGRAIVSPRQISA
jgi:uncharacterized membrane protein